MDERELRLRAVMEWREGEDVSSLLPGADRPPASWTDLPASLPPRQGEGSRRFLVVVEEAQPALGVDAVLRDCARRFPLVTPPPMPAVDAMQELFEAALDKAGLSSLLLDPRQLELKEHFLRGLGVALGAASGQKPVSPPVEKKRAPSPERLLRPAAATLNVSPGLQACTSGESLARFSRQWETARLLASDLMGYLFPRLSLKVNPLLPPHALRLDLHGVTGRVFSFHPQRGCRFEPHLGEPIRRHGGAVVASWLPDGEGEPTDFCSLVVPLLSDEIMARGTEVFTLEQFLTTLQGYQDGLVYRALLAEGLDNVTLWKVLRNLVRERISVRHLGPVFEALLAELPGCRQVDELSERLRLPLRSRIQDALLRSSTGELTVWELPEPFAREAEEERPSPQFFARSAEVAEILHSRGMDFVVLCSQHLRRRMLSLGLPGLVACSPSDLQGLTYKKI